MMRGKVLLAMGVLGLTVQPASAASFVFYENGFSEGATISGFFTGQDTDGNGQISSFEGEVTGFGVSFSGSSLVDPFSLGLRDLYGIVYDLDGTIGDGTTLDIEGVLAADANHAFGVGAALGASCNGTDPCGAVVGSPSLDFSTSLV